MIGLAFSMGIRIEHPRSGFKTALGSAESNLAIVIHQSSYSQNQKVVADLGKGTKSPAIAFVSSAKAPNYLLKSPTGAAATTQKAISGKLVAIIPFVGYLFKVVGL